MSRRAQPDDHLRNYAPYDLRIRPVVLFMIGLTVATLLVVWAMKLTAGALNREAQEGSHAIHPLAANSELPPEPRLQESPALDLARFRAREDEVLSSYGWVDKPAGVIRIPIERAMEIVAKEGLPKR